MKKILISLLFSIVFAISPFNSANAVSGLSEDKRELIDSKIDYIHQRISKHDQSRKNYILKYLSVHLKKKITENNRVTIEYILYKLDGKIAVNSHNSLILRFTKGGNHSTLIDLNKEKIASKDSVFIFRNNGVDLSRSDIQTITSKLKEIHEDILIFIDQEGGYVNRYVDFESSDQIASYFESEYVKSRYNQLSTVEQVKLKSIFPKNYGYFPSLGNLGVHYDSFENDTTKRLFTEIIAYIRLQSLKDNGINTYGLVVDLNYGNPAISLSLRSFSKHSLKYKVLIDSFINASKATGVTLYLKHFPGHGAGKVDSHKGILDLTNTIEYVRENLELFDYFLTYKTNTGGIMVGHIIISNTHKDKFSSVLKKSDFILTDDLAMQGYKQICKNLNGAVSCNQTPGLFSTKEILNSPHLIKVDTQYVENVY